MRYNQLCLVKIALMPVFPFLNKTIPSKPSCFSHFNGLPANQHTHNHAHISCSCKATIPCSPTFSFFPEDQEVDDTVTKAVSSWLSEEEDLLALPARVSLQPPGLE